MKKMSKEHIRHELIKILHSNYNVAPDDASDAQVYNALSTLVMEHLNEKRNSFNNRINSQGRKQIYYLSMEFLMGRSLRNNLHNLGMTKDFEKAIKAIYDIFVVTKL